MSLFDIFSEIKLGNVAKITELVLSNPSLVNQYLYGVTPLLFCIECGKEDVAVNLCSSSSALDVNLCDNLNVSPLERAIEAKYYKVVQHIVQKLKKSQLDNYFIGEETLLTSSLKSDDQNIPISLIKGGVDINKPNKRGEYPIQLTIQYNKGDVLRSMLERQDVELGPFKNGYNPLMDACEKDLTDLSLMLIEAGSSLNEKDEQDWTPLMHAVSNNNELLVTKLTEKGADLCAIDSSGNSLLHLAVLNENEYILALLLGKGAPKTLTNQENNTPLDIAKFNESEDCIKLLM